MTPLVAAMGVQPDPTGRLERVRRRIEGDGWFVMPKGDDFGAANLLYRNYVARAQRKFHDIKPHYDKTFLEAWVRDRIRDASNDRDNTGDDLNLVVVLLMGTFRRDNEHVTWARDHFRDHRPANYGMYLGSYRSERGVDWTVPHTEMSRVMEEGIARKGWTKDAGCSPVLGAFRWYFRMETGGSPGMAKLYEPMIRRYFTPR